MIGGQKNFEIETGTEPFVCVLERVYLVVVR